eukprot:snap_masked-scaffold_50-processed-gene-0.8-mRNA-1 protein AED:1.00 eAED:1.00 QI:0/-1/0/0/-1/1/1/0/455
MEDRIRRENIVSEIHLAAFEGNSQLLESLILKNPDFHPYDSKERTPLYYAIVGHTAVCVETLIDLRPDLLDLPTYTGSYFEFALHTCCKRGTQVNLLALLQFMADVEKRDFLGEQPIHSATTPETFVKLVEYGANATKRNLYSKGNSTFFRCCLLGKLDILRFYFDSRLLHESAHKWLVESEILFKGKNQLTILHVIAAGGHLDMVHFLWEKRVISIEMLEARNLDGKTAADINNGNVCQFLKNIKRIMAMEVSFEASSAQVRNRADHQTIFFNDGRPTSALPSTDKDLPTSQQCVRPGTAPEYIHVNEAEFNSMKEKIKEDVKREILGDIARERNAFRLEKAVFKVNNQVSTNIKMKSSKKMIEPMEQEDNLTASLNVGDCRPLAKEHEQGISKLKTLQNIKREQLRSRIKNRLHVKTFKESKFSALHSTDKNLVCNPSTSNLDLKKEVAEDST